MIINNEITNWVIKYKIFSSVVKFPRQLSSTTNKTSSNSRLQPGFFMYESYYYLKKSKWKAIVLNKKQMKTNYVHLKL